MGGAGRSRPGAPGGQAREAAPCWRGCRQRCPARSPARRSAERRASRLAAGSDDVEPYGSGAASEAARRNWLAWLLALAGKIGWFVGWARRWWWAARERARWRGRHAE